MGRWQAQASTELVEAGQCPAHRWCCAVPGAGILPRVQFRVSVGTRLAGLMGSRRAGPGLAAGLTGSVCPVLPCLSLDHLVGFRVRAWHSTDTCGWAGRSPYSAPASAGGGGGGGGWAEPEQGIPTDTKSWGREQQDGNGCWQAGSMCSSSVRSSRTVGTERG